MALYGARYIQSSDPGAVGVGFEWLNDTTGDMKVRNMSNTAWVQVGNISTTNLGLVPTAGANMSGPLTGVTGWAPVTSPDFKTSAKLEGSDLSTQTWTTAQIDALSEVINQRINEAIVTATSTINVKSNVQFNITRGESQFTAVASPGAYRNVNTQTLTTVILPTYSSGVTANPDDCTALLIWDTENGQFKPTGGQGEGQRGTYPSNTALNGLVVGPATNAEAYSKLYAGTPTIAGVPIKMDAWLADGGVALPIPDIWVRWTLIIFAARG